MREARVCYNHLAGARGVHLYKSLTSQGFLTVGEAGLNLSPDGESFASAFGIDLAPLAKARAPMCRECLDWSERQSHLAGGLGRAFLTRMEDAGWVRRDPGSRAMLFGDKGRRAFADAFPV